MIEKFKSALAYVKHILLYIVGRTPKQLWNKRLIELLKDVPEDKQNIYKTILNNQYNYVSYIDSLNEKQKDIFSEIDIYKLTKSILDNLQPLFNIIGIQPMTGPVGIVTKLHAIHSGEKISLKIKNSSIEAQTRKLTASFLPGMIKDSMAIHEGLDISKEIQIVLGNEVASEYIHAELNNLRALAIKEESGAATPQEILLAIIKESNKIAERSKRDTGNHVIMTSTVWTRIEDYIKTTKSVSFIESDNTKKPTAGLVHVGSINSNSIQLYIDVCNSSDSILIGYKSSDIDVAYHLCPYVMLMCSGMVVDPQTFEPRMTFITRYGVHYSDNASDYYTELSLNLKLDYFSY